MPKETQSQKKKDIDKLKIQANTTMPKNTKKGKKKVAVPTAPGPTGKAHGMKKGVVRSRSASAAPGNEMESQPTHNPATQETNQTQIDPVDEEMETPEHTEAHGPTRSHDLFDIETTGSQSDASIPPGSDAETETPENWEDIDSGEETETVNNLVLGKQKRTRTDATHSGQTTPTNPAPPPDLSTPGTEPPEARTAKGPNNEATATAITTATSNPEIATSQERQTTANKESAEEEEDAEDFAEEIVAKIQEASRKVSTGAFEIHRMPAELLKGLGIAETTGTTKRVQWNQVKTTDVALNMAHVSSCPTDWIDDATHTECEKAAANQAHSLGDLEIPLIHTGTKFLFRLLSHNLTESVRYAWVLHSIRSALSKAELSLTTLRTLVPFSDKPGYDWMLAIFEPEANPIFKDLRYLLDPRSGAAVFVRMWDMKPPKEQILSISGMLSYGDRQSLINEAITRLTEEFGTSITSRGLPLTVTKVARGLAPKAKEMILFNVHLTFTEGAHIFVIPPVLFQGMKIRTSKGTRNIRVALAKKCVSCHSESHPYVFPCPWLDHDVEGRKVNPNAASAQRGEKRRPGDVVPPPAQESKKRKRDEEEEATTPKTKGPTLRDTRPIRGSKKSRKGVTESKDQDEPSPSKTTGETQTAMTTVTMTRAAATPEILSTIGVAASGVQENTM